jgi:hypothetical protein
LDGRYSAEDWCEDLMKAGLRANDSIGFTVEDVRERFLLWTNEESYRSDPDVIRVATDEWVATHAGHQAKSFNKLLAMLPAECERYHCRIGVVSHIRMQLTPHGVFRIQGSRH